MSPISAEDLELIAGAHGLAAQGTTTLTSVTVTAPPSGAPSPAPSPAPSGC